jgi:hypothetical protein
MLSATEVIALDGPILRSALEIVDEYGLSAQDSIVLASVLSHLERNQPPESCFLNRNTRDFDDPDIRELLERGRCKFFAKFGAALGHISSRVKDDEAGKTG